MRYCKWQPGMKALYRERLQGLDSYSPAYRRTEVTVDSITKSQAKIRLPCGRLKTVPQRVL